MEGFALALRLVSIAQTGAELDERSVAAAADPTCLLRPPTLAPRPPPRPTAPRVPSKRVPSVPQLPQGRLSGGVSHLLTRLCDLSTTTDRPLEPGRPSRSPIAALELRPTPLHPKSSAVPRWLAASPCGGDGLWAAPSLRGGLLHWAGANGFSLGAEASAPIVGPEGCAAGGSVGEDWDAEPCVEVIGGGASAAANAAPASAVSSGGGACAVAADPTRNAVWTGHADGRVCCWRAVPLARGPGVLESLRYGPLASWQAHRSAVSALLLAPDGAVWTAGRGGSLRVWPLASAAPAPSAAPSKSQILAAAVGGAAVADGGRQLLRRDGQKPHREVRHLMLVPRQAGGPLVWSAGANSVLVWDAAACVHLRSVRDAADEAADGGAADVRDAPGSAMKMLDRLGRRIATALDKASERLAEGGGEQLQQPRVCGLSPAPGFTVLLALEAPGGRSSIERFTSEGQAMPEARLVGMAAPVRCFCAAPDGRVWAGLANGAIMVLDCARPAVVQLACWQAHPSAVISAAMLPPGIGPHGRPHGQGRIYTLSEDGSIRGWSASAPTAADDHALSVLSVRAPPLTLSARCR